MVIAQSELSSLKCEKLTQQIDSRAVAHLAYHHCLVTDLVLSQEGEPETHKTVASQQY